MPRFLVPAALLIAGLATAAPAQPGTRRFDVGRFDAIELAGSDHVRVVPGNAVSVTAGGDPRAVAALLVEVRGGALHIGRRPGNWHDRGATVFVTVPTLRAVSISGSGDVAVARIARPDFAASVSGSGDLVLSDLRVAGARFRLAGSGSIAATGTAGEVRIEVGGSGRIDARRLAAPDVAVDVGGPGDVAATASRTARVTVGGSGRVRITGGARCSVSRSGTGTVRCG